MVLCARIPSKLALSFYMERGVTRMARPCGIWPVSQFTRRRLARAGGLRATLLVDVDHAVQRMLLAIRPRGAALDIKRSPPFAGLVHARLADDVDHAVSSMLHAVLRRFAALEIEGSCRLAGAPSAAPVGDVDHPGLSMLLAVCPRLGARKIEGRKLLTGAVVATVSDRGNHAVFSMLLAITGRLTALEIVGRYLFLQDLWEQRLLTTFIMPSSACCLQYAGDLLPSTLKQGFLRQAP